MSLHIFNLILKTLLTVVFAVTMSGTVSAAPAGWNAGSIIDDRMFTDYNSMDTSQIQDFLDSKVPSCDTSGSMSHTYRYNSSTGRLNFNGTPPNYTDADPYVTTTRAVYGQRAGSPPPYTCLKSYSESGKSAAQIIYETSQTFHINPKVFLVLLQKENSFITDDWPWPFQYRSATGYGCPDPKPPNYTPVPCNAQYYGFRNQMIWAGTMYRAILNGGGAWSNEFSSDSSWYTPYILGNNYILYNPNVSCGGSVVNIQNRSTQALYNYTPYQPNQAALNAGWGSAGECGAYGNRNFYLYMQEWFGYSPLTLVSPPTSISWGPGRIDIFAKGSDGGLWQKWYSDGSWKSWARVTQSHATPSISSWSSGRLDIFETGAAGDLRHNWYSHGSGWGSWESLGRPNN